MNDRTLGAKLRVLRAAKDMSQSDLAEKSGVRRGAISLYEGGKKNPDALTLERLLRGLGFTWASLDGADDFLEFLKGCSAADVRGVPRGDMEARSEALCRFLESLLSEPPERRKALIEERPEAKDPHLSELLCLESERLCLADPRKAAEVAELAIFAAERLSDGGTRPEYLSYTYAHLGNARRVQGDLPGAEAAFECGACHWNPEAETPSVVDAGRILALKASLRIAQRRLPEAWDLLSRARERSRDSLLEARILVSMSRVLDEQGEWEAAIAKLHEAEPYADPERDPRLVLCIRHNLVWLLTLAGRHEEARERLPEAIGLSRRLGSVLDRVRLRWVEGRILAETGEAERATRLFSRVRAEFLSRDMGYDAALVSLEMAVVYTREGRTAEVKALARHMVPIFQSQDVHREALAALALFRQAAEAEKATEELARKVLLYLQKARLNPELRFSLNADAAVRP